MDIGQLFRRAWEITWKHKILWVFGLLIALASGAGGGSGSGYSLDGSEVRMPHGAVLALLIILALLVLVALIVLATIAQGALIDGARQAHQKGEVKGSEAWRRGTVRFWPLLGIGALMFVVVLILIIPLIAMVLLAVLPVSRGVGAGEGGVFAAICGTALCCVPLVPLSIAISLIATYASRACVLDGLGVLASIAKGWQVLKEKLGPTLLIGVLLFAIQMVIGGFIGSGLAAVIMPAGFIEATRSSRAALIPLCCLGLLGGLLALAINMVLQTFTSTTWTLAYLGWNEEKAALAEPIEPVEPVATAEIPSAAEQP